MRPLMQRLQQEWQESSQQFTTCPFCHQWSPRGACPHCGTGTESGAAATGAAARPGLIPRLRAELQQAAARFTVCGACGQWTAPGACAACGAPAGQPAVAGPAAQRPALIRWNPSEQAMLLFSLLKWLALGSLVGVLSGTASAAFLTALEWATGTRVAHPGLLWALPAAGLLIGWIYSRLGRGAEKGNNLILDQIHRPQGQVPLRMAPLVLLGTVTTHLFGGSAGREGTAVQMGASLADGVARLLRLAPGDRRILLMSGISGGFGSVFGTPLAGTVFGMEVLRVGAIRYEALVACLAAAFVGDQVTVAWGIHHGHYAVAAVPALTTGVLGRVLLAGVAFGLAALLFAELAHGCKSLFGALAPSPLLRPVVGGFLVIGLTYLAGTREYLGLGVPMIRQAFTAEPVPALAFLWKTVFTTLTLGAGFQGGEVTPLFFVGATLGNALASPLALPPDFLAALGFVAVFAGAANTPLACILMGAELFGAGPLPFIGVASVISYVISGHRGIYAAQRVETAKSQSVPVPPGTALRALHAVTPPLLRR